MLILPTPTPEHVCMMEVVRKFTPTGNYLQRYDEALEWLKHGFAPEEAGEWLEQGYKELAYLAAKLRYAGLSPRQGGCALGDLEYLLRPGYGWEEEDRFLRRALAYKGCCMGPP